MKIDDVKDLKADKMYRFYFKNGSVIEMRGSGLLQAKSGVWRINEYKLKRIYKIEAI